MAQAEALDSVMAGPVPPRRYGVPGFIQRVSANGR